MITKRDLEDTSRNETKKQKGMFNKTSLKCNNLSLFFSSKKSKEARQSNDLEGKKEKQRKQESKEKQIKK